MHNNIIYRFIENNKKNNIFGIFFWKMRNAADYVQMGHIYRLCI